MTAPDAAPPPAARPSLIGRSRGELAQLLVEQGEPAPRAAMRARQLWHWLYHQGATDFAAMTTLPLALRERLATRYDIARPTVVREQVSTDGTRKWLLRCADGQEVESVFIPEADRGALCLSTQVGCSLTCAFCHTGTMPLVRNLGSAEIVGQLLAARDALGEWPTPAGARRLSHLVVMGMGEPLLNYEQTARALKRRDGPRRPRLRAAQDHALDLGRGAADRGLRARPRRRARDLAARGTRRAARPARAD